MLNQKLEASARTPIHREVELGLNSETTHSSRWFERAKRCLAGGISSSARATTCGDLPHPLYISRGHGSRIWDADGNQFIDYLLGYGSSILGHADQAIVDAVEKQVRLGTMFGTCNTVEVELAEQIRRMVKTADLVRFANSGSEAMSGAVRAARGFTGKNKILKFEGHYHGWVDVLSVSNRPTAEEAGPVDHPLSVAHSRGTPAGVVSDVIICPWNSISALTHLLDENEAELAAVVCEPMVANNSCLMPEPGFLEHLRDECTRRKIVLIFDEIVTGFRVASGGAQELLDVPADLAVYAKALGGGTPLAAFAGRRDILEAVAANKVKHGGTYNGNPLCAAAGLATLRKLAREDVQERLRKHGQILIEAMERAAHDLSIDCVVQGMGTMFQIVFTNHAVRHYRDLFTADAKRYAAFRQSLLELGIHSNSSGMACWFVSAAHTDDDAQITAAAIAEAMKAAA